MLTAYILLLAVPVVAVLLCPLALRTRGQHVGAGEGALTVVELVARTELERQRETAGRHRLREVDPVAERVTVSLSEQNAAALAGCVSGDLVVA